jgi:hypothetical protein
MSGAGMTVRIFKVVCEWDDEAKLWFVADSDVPGLVAEAPSREAMSELLQRRVPELLELNMPELADQHAERPPLELLIQSQQRVRIHSNNKQPSHWPAIRARSRNC